VYRTAATTGTSDGVLANAVAHIFFISSGQRLNDASRSGNAHARPRLRAPPRPAARRPRTRRRRVNRTPHTYSRYIPLNACIPFRLHSIPYCRCVRAGDRARPISSLYAPWPPSCPSGRQRVRMLSNDRRYRKRRPSVAVAVQTAVWSTVRWVYCIFLTAAGAQGLTRVIRVHPRRIAHRLHPTPAQSVRPNRPRRISFSSSFFFVLFVKQYRVPTP